MLAVIFGYLMIAQPRAEGSARDGGAMGFCRSFFWPVTVQAEHIDALAHTRNTHYVEWCMEAAWAHTTAVGLGAKDYQRLDRAMALTHAEYDYLKATREGIS